MANSNFGVFCLITPTIASTEIPLYVDGWDVTDEVSPILVNNRTMVPVRFISEKLGAEVQWQEPDIIIEKDDSKLVLTIGFKNAYKNNNLMEKIEVSPFLKESRTMVPLRFIIEAFDVDIDYINNEARVVTPSFKKKKADYFDLALKMRFDYLPFLADDENLYMPSFLMYAFFRHDDYPECEEMSTEYLEKLAKDNFAIENLDHMSTKEWAFDGERYAPTGWSYSNSCIYELVREKSYTWGDKIFHEAVLDGYYLYEYEFSSLDFIPDIGGDYSQPMMYVLNKKGDEIKNALSTIDAVKSLIVEGDTANFKKRMLVYK